VNEDTRVADVVLMECSRPLCTAEETVPT
jgi:hypothetical protein